MIILYLFLIFFSAQSINTFNIKYLKDTHAILPNNNYAPFWGLVFLEEGIAEQWYRLDSKYQIKGVKEFAVQYRKDVSLNDTQKEQADSLEQRIIDALTIIESSATDKLVKELFHATGGHFGVTVAKNNPISQLMPKHIGAICNIIYESTLNFSIKKDELFKKVLLDLIKTRKKIDKKDFELSTLELFNQNKKILTDKIGHLLPIIFQNYLKEQLMQYLVDLNFTKFSKSLFQKKDYQLFVDALVGSLQECNPGNPAQKYVKNTTQGLLLGYMLAKVHNISDLQDYFRGFMHDDTFTLDGLEYTNDELVEITNKPLDINNISSLGDYLCAVIFVNRYMSALPKIVSSTEVKYQGNLFPDCVETMMRNLVNIITYKSSTQQLGVMPKGLIPNLQLKTFFANKNNVNPAMVTSLDVHRAWLKLVENQEGCSYNRILIRGTNQYIEVKQYCDGVVPVDNIDPKLPQKEITIGNEKFIVFEKKVDNSTYWLTPATGDLDCFELMPTVSNIIVLLNRLFNLNLTSLSQAFLYKLKGQSFVDQVLQDNFVQKYFKRMCKKLQWNIDIDDLLNSNIEIPIELTTGDIFIIQIMEKMHGSILVDSESNLTKQINFETFESLDQSIKAAMLASKSIDIYNDDFEILIPNLFKNLNQFIPVINKDNKIHLIQKLVGHKQNERYINLLLLSCALELDPYYQNLLFSNLMIYNIPPSQTLQILEILADFSYLTCDNIYGKAIIALLKQNYDNIWEWLTLGINDLQDDNRRSVINFLFYVLSLQLSIDQIFEHDKVALVLSWIDKYLQNVNLGSSCADLLLELIKKNKIEKTQVDQTIILLTSIPEFIFDQNPDITKEAIVEAEMELKKIKNL